MRPALPFLFLALLLCGCGEGDDPQSKPQPDGLPTSENAGLSQGAVLVLSLNGKVVVTNTSDSKEEDAYENQFLTAGDFLVTGPRSNALLLLTNGTSLKVGPNTTFKLKAFNQAPFKGGDEKVQSIEEETSISSVLLDLKVGEMVVDVKKLKKKSNFEISTPLGVAGIRGTSFRLLASFESTDLSVLTGQVDFFAPAGKRFQIKAGQKIFAPKGEAPKINPLAAIEKQAIEEVLEESRNKTDSVKIGTLELGLSSLGTNHKGSELPPDGSLHILMHVDGSGSILSTRKALEDMKDTLLKRALLPYYGNNEDLYRKRVRIIDGEGERTLRFYTQSTKHEEVLAMVFQDEAQPDYHLPNFNRKPETNYLKDLNALRTKLNAHNGLYRGIMFQVDRGKTYAKSFKDFVRCAWRGEGYLANDGHNLRPYYFENNRGRVFEGTRVVFSDEYHANSEGSTEYYFKLILQAARKIGLELNVSASPLEAIAKTKAFSSNRPAGPIFGPTYRVDEVEGLEMLWVKPGTFMMGGHSKFPDLNQRGKERHRVILSQGFYLGKHEVTQAQWKKIMTGNPSQWKGDQLPVEKVNWTQAMKFCSTLTEREHSKGRLPRGWKYTLPTEAQWEYTCRAGTSTLFSFGDKITKNEVNFTRHVRKTTPVGKYPPNQWGFHDMHGNVREWCKDFHGEYPLLSVIDPEGPLNGTKRLARGGAWDNSPPYVESAARGAISGSKRENIIGFRLALTKSN